MWLEVRPRPGGGDLATFRDPKKVVHSPPPPTPPRLVPNDTKVGLGPVVWDQTWGRWPRIGVGAPDEGGLRPPLSAAHQAGRGSGSGTAEGGREAARSVLDAETRPDKRAATTAEEP